MKCIVTAGPTYEELDEVRRMTNFSTGALGTVLAGFLAAQGHEVVLLRGHYSTDRMEGALPAQVFTTSGDLCRKLQALRSAKVGAVFHAAAVGDFIFGKIWRRGPDDKLLPIKSGKIPTREGSILAELKPTAKVIARLRAWFPKAQLIGWKYEVDGVRRDVIRLGEEQMRKNNTDACVVNGPAYGKGFGLVTGVAACQYLRNREDLFEALDAFIARMS